MRLVLRAIATSAVIALAGVNASCKKQAPSDPQTNSGPSTREVLAQWGDPPAPPETPAPVQSSSVTPVESVTRTTPRARDLSPEQWLRSAAKSAWSGEKDLEWAESREQAVETTSGTETDSEQASAASPAGSSTLSKAEPTAAASASADLTAFAERIRREEAQRLETAQREAQRALDRKLEAERQAAQRAEAQQAEAQRRAIARTYGGGPGYTGLGGGALGYTGYGAGQSTFTGYGAGQSGFTGYGAGDTGYTGITGSVGNDAASGPPQVLYSPIFVAPVYFGIPAGSFRWPAQREAF